MNAPDRVLSGARLAALAILTCPLPFLDAATALREFEPSQPPGKEPVLRVDFSLPEPYVVTAVEASVGGRPVESSKVKYSAAGTLPDQRCAILLLVDNTPDMADYLPKVRLLVQTLADYAETPPWQIGLATFSDDVRVLVPIGGKKADLKSPETVNKLDGSGPSTEIYLSAQHAIPILAQTKAPRKHLVIISNGRGEDKKYTHDETVAAARAAKVRISTVGYAQPQGDNPSYLQTLTKLSEETGGYKVRADVLTRQLPVGADSNLLKQTLSGGRAEVSLAGLAAPLTVDFKITTDSRKEYSFNHRIEAFAVPVAPPPPPKPPQPPPTAPEKKPEPTPEKKPEPTPDKGAGKTPPSPGKPTVEPDKPATQPDKPADKPSDKPVVAPGGEISGAPVAQQNRWEKAWSQVLRFIREKPNLAAMAGGAVAILLLLVILAGRRALGGPAAPAPSPAHEPPVVAPQFVAADAAPPVAPPPAPALAWLESLDAEQTRYPIRKTAVRLGRKEDNDITFRNDSVSSHHAEIVRRGSQFVISNLAAANGVYVNNKRVESSPLEHNDLIELGEVRFRFVLDDAPQSQP